MALEARISLMIIPDIRSAVNLSRDLNFRWLGDELEFWPEKTGAKEPVRFVKIAVLHSELVAVSSNGHLYQWRWCDMTPFRGDNPSGNNKSFSDFEKL